MSSPRRRETTSLLIVYVLVMAAGLLPLFSVSALSPFLVRSGLVTGADLGIAWGLFFGVASLSSPSVGRFVDARPERMVIAGLFVLVASALTFLSLATTAWTVMVVYAIAGVGPASSFALTNRWLGARSGLARGSVHIGIAHAGTQAGALFSGLLLPLVAVEHGWRWALASAVGVTALGLVILAWAAAGDAWSAPDPPSRSAVVMAGGARAGHGVRADPVREVTVRLPATLYVYAAVGNGAATTAAGYLPLFVSEDAGRGPRMGALALSLVAVMAIGGKVAWGRAAGHARDWRSSASLLAGGAAVGMALLVGGVGSGPLLWAGIVLIGAFGQAWAVVTMSGVVRLAPSAAAGQASGKVLMSGFAGAALLPPAFGALAEGVRGHAPVWIALLVAYAGAVVVLYAPVSIGRSLRALPERHRIEEAHRAKNHKETR